MSDRELRSDRRMSDLEALMWNLEKDPRLSASIANITIFDRPPDPVRLRTRLLRAAEAVPRLHQRVVPSLGRLAPPEWRDDPDFDLDHHLRWVALPAPGAMRQLLDLACTIANDPFDRTRPLWSFVVVEGLEGGRAAMVQKLHHTIADGVGGIRMSEQFIDLEADATEPIAPLRPPPPPITSTLARSTVDAVGHNLRRWSDVVARSGAGAASLATDPRRALEVVGDSLDLGRSALRQLVVTDRAHSPLWTERTLRRRIEVLRAPMDEARSAAKALGGSLNDLFVAAAAGAAGQYHRRAGVEVDEMRMAMPVNTRRDRSAGGNAFSPARVLVPVGIEDPVKRFEAVRVAVGAVRTERSLASAEGLAGVANLLPTSVLVRFARQQVETVDFTTSNVRGAPFPLYIAGARILSNHPIGPTGGTAWNLTLMSYDGSLDMGLNVDSGAVEEPELLRDLIEASMEELVQAAKPSKRSKPRKAAGARKGPRS